MQKKRSRRPRAEDAQEDDDDDSGEDGAQPGKECELSGYPIDATVVADAIREQLKNFRRQYKQQTDETAKQKKAAADHAGRVESSKRAVRRVYKPAHVLLTMAQKLIRRRAACAAFDNLYGRDPEPLLMLELQSGDESAGDDEDLKTRYEQLLNLNTASRQANKGIKIVATQVLEFRAQVSTLQW